MKKLFFVFQFLFLFCFFSEAQSKKIALKHVNAINISSSFELFIKQGDAESIEVSASNEEYLDKINVTIENGEVIIRYDNQKSFWLGWNSDRLNLKAVVTLKNLEKLTTSGACNTYFEEGINVENLSINVSGASDVKGNLTVKNLNVEMSGASDVLLSGSVSNLKVNVSGASDFKGYNLNADYCNSKLSGAASAKISVNKELTANASGASSVKYIGSGIIRDIKMSGASSISRKS